MPKRDDVCFCGAAIFNKTQNLPVLPLPWFPFLALQSLRLCFQKSILVSVFVPLCCYVHSWIFCVLWGFLCEQWFAFADSNGGSLASPCLSQTHLWLALANGQWTVTTNSGINSHDLSLWVSWPKLKHSKRYFISNSIAFFVSGWHGLVMDCMILFCRIHFLKIWNIFLRLK